MIDKAILSIMSDAKFALRGDTLEWLDERPQPNEAEIQAKIEELQAAEPMRQLRIKRTAILAESDWMANSDVTMSDAWRDYRQSLRDLPATASPTLDDNGNLIVDWPTPPDAV